MQKDLGGSFSGWVNFEVSNRYNSFHNWGDFTLEEAWVKYSRNEKLNIKAGQLIPRFNALNEVKNRMPYLPYVFRPLVYEASVKGTLPPEDYLPERAFFQVYGEIPLSDDVSTDYALFLGDAESSFIRSEETANGGLRGTDSTNHNLVGGRFGISGFGFKAGASLTRDQDNLVSHGLGEPNRTRIGFDVNYSIGNLTLDGEFIQVDASVDSSGLDLKKTFYYGTALYDLTENIFAYTMYSKVDDKAELILKDGLKTISVGGGYRFTDAVLLKIQYANYYLPDGKINLGIPGLPYGSIDLDIKALYFAISVFF